MSDLLSVYERFSPEPLSGDGLKKFYVNAFEGRGDQPVKKLARRLKNKPDGKLQILFSGYRGCGKSTELNKLQKDIGDEFVSLNFSVAKELDPVNIRYSEIFIITMEKLFELADTHHLSIEQDILTRIQKWYSHEELKELQSFTGELTAEIGVEGKFGVSLLAKIFGKLRAAGNASFNTKKLITQKIEPRLSDLIGHCNTLIREIKNRLPDIGKKGLLIIIEDLDKLSLSKAEELFFKHSHILNGLQTHVIFTFPISLRHHNKSTIIKSNFDEDFELPMVKVNDKNGNPYGDGREVLQKIIQKRINLNCFENRALIEKFIAMSGGCIRDLFRMIMDAADSALDNEREQITEADFRKSFLRLKRDYENTVAEKRIDHQIVISVEEYYRTLKDAAESRTKKIDNTDAALDLRQNLCILSYNDEGWSDVHPIVRRILEERELISPPCNE
ncbi:conserved hypothetical protein [Chloroherpeton thalassium ATCC 35110]|uniref:KAP NTPase domain-containing protein n=1 Tax=Chloroherpeton thalassium (strain ATCC 35110 / GB-78) TaxID=517418 RepID=B3QRQ2_CHLT3|nr:P-loop NTPase fold protein [Chloroherpeton thalassium]ACF13855.1 conserved hypothetical protein [Chloroherpeton thalassium ATCC 35110]